MHVKGLYLNRDPGCATLRCTFTLQIFYIFIFYFVSPNLGHFGTKPVGLLPCASVQFYALVHPVQPTHPVPRFHESFYFTIDVIQPLVPMPTMVSCATLWPLTMLFKLHGNSCWSSSKSRYAPCNRATSSLQGFHFAAASSSLLHFPSFTLFSSSRLLSPSSSSFRPPAAPMFSPVWA